MEDSKKIYKFIGNPGEDFQIWAALKGLSERCSVRNVVAMVQLQAKSVKLRYSDQIMSDYIDQFEEVFSRLDGMKSIIQEKVPVVKLLASFGDKVNSPFGHVILSVKTVSDSLSWERVTARLLQEYDQQTRQQVPKASEPYGQAPRVGKSRQNRNDQNCRAMSASIRCCECNEMGHVARCCRKRGTKMRKLDKNEEGLVDLERLTRANCSWIERANYRFMTIVYILSYILEQAII